MLDEAKIYNIESSEGLQRLITLMYVIPVCMEYK